MSVKIILGIALNLIVSGLILVQCHQQTDTQQLLPAEELPQHEYKVRWNANPEVDMSHYLVYAWHGADSSRSPFAENSSAGRYAQYFVKKTSHRLNVAEMRDTVSFVANGDWLQFAIAAVNQSGGVSPIGTSNFLKSQLPVTDSVQQMQSASGPQ